MRETIGYVAGLLATIAFLPQVAKTVRDRSVKDISLGMYVLFCSGVTLWLLYGFLISSWPIIVSNFVTLVLAGTVLAMKIKLG
jgi:MtN3 and saliva related transmembrane protein